jgi:hypothetical protein
MLLLMKLAESLNLEISTRGLGYRREVRVVRMWSDMYRDRGEYICTWLETGEVREWTDVPLHLLEPEDVSFDFSKPLNIYPLVKYLWVISGILMLLSIE